MVTVSRNGTTKLCKYHFLRLIQYLALYITNTNCPPQWLPNPDAYPCGTAQFEFWKSILELITGDC